jgi:hypothetical protein
MDGQIGFAALTFHVTGGGAKEKPAASKATVSTAGLTDIP